MHLYHGEAHGASSWLSPGGGATLCTYTVYDNEDVLSLCVYI